MTREEKLKILKGDASAKPTRAEALAILKGEKAPEQSSDPAMAIGQGLAKSALATPGIPSSIREWVSNLPATTPEGKWLKENLGPSLGMALKYNPITGPVLYGPTSQEILSAVDKNVVPIKDYEGPLGYVERAAEFATPLPGGKGRAVVKATQKAAPTLKKAISEFATSTPGRELATSVGAGVGSKGAEDIAESLDASDTTKNWASFIGSLAGLKVGMGKKSNALKMAAEDAPSKSKLALDTEDAYEALKPIPVDKQLYRDTLNKIAKAAKPAGVKVRHASDLFNDLEELSYRRHLTLDEVMALRQEAGRDAMYNHSNPHISKAGDIISEKLDEYIENASPLNPNLGQQFRDAKELGRSQAKSMDIETARGSGFASQMGDAIGQMNKVRALAGREAKTWSPMEHKGLQDIVGRNARNPLRIMGRGFQGFLPQATAIGGSMATGGLGPILGGLGLGFLGRGLEKYADSRSLQKLDDLVAAIRAGRPIQEAATLKAGKRNEQRSRAGYKGILGAIRVKEQNNRGQE